jgi:dethiobiotin synthetase
MQHRVSAPTPAAPVTPHGLFVAGTDTGVGKTFVSTGLVAAAARDGRRVAVMKPVAAGAEPTPDGLRNDDALALVAAARCDAPYADVNPVCLPLPASPHIAAAEAGVRIELPPLRAAATRLAAGADWLLVEGAGGWRAPIGARETMADVAGVLGLPVLLVVGLRLGCLNHAQLTHAAILADGLPFAGWIGNLVDPGMARVAENVAWLTEALGEPLAVLPWGTSDGRAAEVFREAFATASRRLLQL